jgi:4-aminobutyrate aminotransferase-like enzyme
MSAPGQRHALQAVRGRGTQLTLADGRIVIDVGAMSANLLGHCHPEVVAAVQAAAETVNLGDMVGYPPREQAVDDILDIAYKGEDWAGSVALFVSSSEAADLGLGLAQMLTGREPLVCRRSGYHGGVGLAREVSHHPMWNTSLAALAGGALARPGYGVTREIPVPECGRAFRPAGHDCAGACLDGAADALADAAAVIMDYSQGGVVPSAQYQDALANMARDAGAMWIADETVTAYGRMGHGFAFQRGSTRPDMVTMGKGITGGAVPAGALILSKEVVEAIGERRWMTSSTYRGHPLAVAAMSAVVKVIERDQLVERAARLGESLGPDLQSIADSHPSVRGVIGEGLSWLINVVEPDRSLDEDEWRGDGQHTGISNAVHQAILDQGVLIPEFSGERLWIVPPLIISESDLATALEALDSALSVADRILEAAGAIG